MGKSRNLGFSNFEGNNQITWFCYGPPYKLYFTICDLEKLLTSSLLMPHLWDSTSNEPSLNKTFESKEIFHLSSTQYSQNIVFYNDLEELLISLLLMSHLRDSTLNEPSLKKFESEKIFHLSSKLCIHCNLKPCMAKVIIKRL